MEMEMERRREGRMETVGIELSGGKERGRDREGWRERGKYGKGKTIREWKILREELQREGTIYGRER